MHNVGGYKHNKKAPLVLQLPCTDPKKLDLKSNFWRSVFLAKYSYEFKQKVVSEYLKGGIGYKKLAKKYGIPSDIIVRRWIKAFTSLGSESLKRSRSNTNYTFAYKLHVVESYLTSEISYQELALKESISNPSLITRWVNDFKIAGPAALRPKKKGRKKSLKRKNNSYPVNTDNPDVTADKEHIKQLEDELLRLRIENAYLKELRRLRLEEEALQKKLRE